MEDKNTCIVSMSGGDAFHQLSLQEETLIWVKLNHKNEKYFILKMVELSHLICSFTILYFKTLFRAEIPYK
jgi:hypothetical protein